MIGRGSRLNRSPVDNSDIPPLDTSKVWFDPNEKVFKSYDSTTDSWTPMTSSGSGGDLGYTPIDKAGDILQGNLIVADGVSIEPFTADGATLGSPLKPFKDVYVGANSLYVDGNKTISSTNTTLDVTTSVDQHLSVSTSGLGTTRLASGKETIVHAGQLLNLQSYGDVNTLSKGRVVFKTDMDGEDIVFETEGTLSNINFKTIKAVNFDSPEVVFTSTPKVGTKKVLLEGEALTTSTKDIVFILGDNLEIGAQPFSEIIFPYSGLVSKVNVTTGLTSTNSSNLIFTLQKRVGTSWTTLKTLELQSGEFSKEIDVSSENLTVNNERLRINLVSGDYGNVTNMSVIAQIQI